MLAIAILAGAALTFSNPYLHRRKAHEPSRAISAESTSFTPPAHGLTGDLYPYCTTLYHSVCHSRGITRDPTGSVSADVEGELQAVHIYQDLMRKHPEWTSEQIEAEAVNRIYTPQRRARIEAAYRWVRDTLERYIDRQPDAIFNFREKVILKHRLQKTALQLPPPASAYYDEPDLFTKNDVFYEQTQDGNTRMRVGGAYLFTAKSWFNILFTVAHELAHSIDPCELRANHIDIPAYDRLSGCFKQTGLVAMRPDRQECGENDQLSETFADWMAVKVAAEALGAFSRDFKEADLIAATTNSVRDLCEQDEEGEVNTETHPEPRIRIERIFGQNPEIRQVLGCGLFTVPLAPHEYCSFTPNPYPQSEPGHHSL